MVLHKYNYELIRMNRVIRAILVVRVIIVVGHLFNSHPMSLYLVSQVATPTITQEGRERDEASSYARTRRC